MTTFVKDIPFAEPYAERALSVYTRKGVIYVIQNTTNGRCYVGQTVQTFAERYGNMGMWWESTTNKPLLEDLAIYGAGAFRLRILEHSKTQDELNQLEPFHAERFDAYWPKGYNKQRCGVVKTKHRPLSKLGTIELNDPSGRDVVIVDAAMLCETHGLNRTLLRELIEGKLSYHKGWTAKGNTDKVDPRKGRYTLYDKDGTKHEIGHGLKAFCDEKGLNYHLMVCMVNGGTYTSQGYALAPEAFGKRKSRYVVTLTKDGQDVTTGDIKANAKCVFGIHDRFVYEIINGRKLSHKGWTFKAVSRIPTRH